MPLSSLFPFRDLWDILDYPARLNDQHLGMGIPDSDLLPAAFQRGFPLRPRTPANIDSSRQSEVKNEADKFKVMLNVSQFKPSEISVKTVDNHIVIHGKHEEKADEHGFVTREFTRCFLLPEGVEPNNVVSKMGPNGVLVVEAPRKAIEPPKSNVRIVPIILDKPAVASKQTSQPE